MQLSCFETKLPNLMLKTLSKQLLGSLPLDIAPPKSLIHMFLVIFFTSFTLRIFVNLMFRQLTLSSFQLWEILAQSDKRIGDQ
jgi:hypothetical protein